ncbi:hypothetical protein DFP72DRAFT_847905 [Ephemerocybe angulata]|uniref:Uncharacterized protein n=1 Tax=Ephemerocybe angulata TaxID=980116 RepID=A0A8H6HZ04_9AGAR|nr:hypothetical protein DFP72DRAFT_847905 [Tulosesus angulatus]
MIIYRVACCGRKEEESPSAEVGSSLLRESETTSFRTTTYLHDLDGLNCTTFLSPFISEIHQGVRAEGWKRFDRSGLHSFIAADYDASICTPKSDKLLWPEGIYLGLLDRALIVGQQVQDEFFSNSQRPQTRTPPTPGRVEDNRKAMNSTTQGTEQDDTTRSIDNSVAPTNILLSSPPAKHPSSKPPNSTRVNPRISQPPHSRPQPRLHLSLPQPPKAAEVFNSGVPLPDRPGNGAGEGQWFWYEGKRIYVGRAEKARRRKVMESEEGGGIYGEGAFHSLLFWFIKMDRATFWVFCTIVSTQW